MDYQFSLELFPSFRRFPTHNVLAHTQRNIHHYAMFLRSATRAAALRSSAIRTAPSPMACLTTVRPQAQQAAVAVPQQTRAASEHAIANPTLASIEKRWEALPPQEQADLWMQLRDRMKVDWHQMTAQEKKAGMRIPLSGGSVLI